MTEIRCNCGKKFAEEEPGKIVIDSGGPKVEIHMGVVVWTCPRCREKTVRNTYENTPVDPLWRSRVDTART